ncbi:Acyl carrier protein [Polynucleobacter duraquae]|uniref:Acyl carrier protein n=1 Tax=Polynucleobacter duraquae TaxID=1835254 RepID=A0A0E3V0K7_9BURK|nr:acyl carrier protein [Polynucleobacter duraquae]AKD24678.1 Acyl carrier protein [Polynucleobacter duraquae]
MINNEILLKNTVAKVLGVNLDDINDDSSMDNLHEWDSVKHLNLVLAIEEVFGISMTEEQSLEMLSFPLIKLVLSEHNINF